MMLRFRSLATVAGALALAWSAGCGGSGDAGKGGAIVANDTLVFRVTGIKGQPGKITDD